MKGVIEIVYPYDLFCEYMWLSEFYRVCGIYVYETSMDFPEWEKKSDGTGIGLKIYLIHDLEQAKKALQPKEINKIFVLCDCSEEVYRWCKGKAKIYIKKEMSDLRLLLAEVYGMNNITSFLNFFSLHYAKEDLGIYIYLLKYMKYSDTLTGDATKNIKKTIQILKNRRDDFSNEAEYYFVCAYLCNLINDAQRDKYKKEYSFQSLMEYCNRAYERNPGMSTINELKGDIYFSFANNYFFGISCYERCLNRYNYTAPFKLSRYWANNSEGKRNEEKYLSKALECNSESFDAAVRLAAIYEEELKFEKALEIYNRIVHVLQKKVEKTHIALNEFYSLCISHKRIGCIVYKMIANPLYYKAIDEYKKIFDLWNASSHNQFIKCFPSQYSDELINCFKNSFHIRGVISSLSKIYDLLGKHTKSNLCRDLYLDMPIEGLDMIPTEEIF